MLGVIEMTLNTCKLCGLGIGKDCPHNEKGKVECPACGCIMQLAIQNREYMPEKLVDYYCTNKKCLLYDRCYDASKYWKDFVAEIERIRNEALSHVDDGRTGDLYLTSGNRIVRDDHNCEAYFKSDNPEKGDRVLMTRAELKNGISLRRFKDRLMDMGAL
jgi:hypothetical protein